jgi:heptosyltransferase-2/heptosyltransferase-3
MALPATAALRTAHPAATITAFVGPHSAAAFDHQRPIDRVRILSDQLGPIDALRLARQLRRGAFDLAVLLDRSRWGRLALRWSGVERIARVVAHDPETRHESTVYLDVIRSLGIDAAEREPNFELPDRARAAAFLLVGETRRVAVLHPGGAENPGATMHSKRWQPERFAALARELSMRGITVVLSGGGEDRELAIEVAREAGLPESRVVAGRADLVTTGAILERAALYVGPDTGVSHVAAALGTPSVVIFGPTNPRRFRPLGKAVIVVAPPTSSDLPDVDLRRSHATVDAVSTDRVSLQEVLAACDALLAAHSDRA